MHLAAAVHDVRRALGQLVPDVAATLPALAPVLRHALGVEGRSAADLAAALLGDKEGDVIDEDAAVYLPLLLELGQDTLKSRVTLATLAPPGLLAAVLAETVDLTREVVEPLPPPRLLVSRML